MYKLKILAAKGETNYNIYYNLRHFFNGLPLDFMTLNIKIITMAAIFPSLELPCIYYTSKEHMY